MSLARLRRLFSRDEGRKDWEPLYRAAIAEARDPFWYAHAAVPDTIDGRFDMLGSIVALLLIRLESDKQAGQTPGVMLTELFIDDMDGQLRQAGIGDIVVGKHVGKLLGALGGRLESYRAAFETGHGLDAALDRNLYRGTPVDAAARSAAAERMRALHRQLAACPLDRLKSGALA